MIKNWIRKWLFEGTNKETIPREEQYLQNLIDTLEIQIQQEREERLRLTNLVYKRLGLVTEGEAPKVENHKMPVGVSGITWPRLRRRLEIKESLAASHAALKEVEEKEAEWLKYQKELEKKAEEGGE